MGVFREIFQLRERLVLLNVELLLPVNMSYEINCRVVLDQKVFGGKHRN